MTGNHARLTARPVPDEGKHDLIKTGPALAGVVSGLNTGCEPKGRQFNSQSGHMPGLQARFPVRAR